jgi:hypothetical protein
MPPVYGKYSIETARDANIQITTITGGEAPGPLFCDSSAIYVTDAYW